jgi:hypothetical protein
VVVVITRATASRVALGTVPGTVREVTRMVTCKATRTAILGLVLAAIAMVSLRAIPAGTRCPIRKVTCLVVGKANAEATLEVKWVRTCGGTLRATPTATSAATCAVGLGREPDSSIRRQAFDMEREWRRVCKPSSVRTGLGHDPN